MRKAKKKPSRLGKALLKTAASMRKSGVLDQVAYDKIAVRHCGSSVIKAEAGEIAEERKRRGA